MQARMRKEIGQNVDHAVPGGVTRDRETLRIAGAS